MSTKTWMLVVDAEQYFLDVTAEEVTGIRGFVDYFNARFCSEEKLELGDQVVMRFEPISHVQLDGGSALELLRYLDRQKATAMECLELMQTALQLAAQR